MSTIAEKLNLLLSTKAAIKAAIEAKGVTVGNIPFSQYPGKISLISGGGSGGGDDTVGSSSNINVVYYRSGWYLGTVNVGDTGSPYYRPIGGILLIKNIAISADTKVALSFEYTTALSVPDGTTQTLTKNVSETIPAGTTVKAKNKTFYGKLLVNPGPMVSILVNTISWTQP